MRVHIHQAGHDGVLGESHERVAALRLDITASDIRDLSVLDHDRHFGLRLVIPAVDQSSGMNDRRRLNVRSEGPTKNDRHNHAPAHGGFLQKKKALSVLVESQEWSGMVTPTNDLRP